MAETQSPIHTPLPSQASLPLCVSITLPTCPIANIVMGFSYFWYKNMLSNRIVVLCYSTYAFVRGMESDEKLENNSSSFYLLFMATCVFAFVGLVHELLLHISEFIGLKYPFAKMLNCQKHVTGCASLKNQLELIVLKLFT